MILSQLLIGTILASTPECAQDARQIAKTASPSVYLILTEDKNGNILGLGSGFLAAEGVIVSNYHVLAGAARARVKAVGEDSKVLSVSGFVAADAENDLIAISVPEAKEPLLSVDASSKLEIGQRVWAIGNPSGLEGTISEGIVSGIRGENSKHLLQITAAISPGSSGGPILNEHSKVIGVAVGYLGEGQALNFAIPSVHIVELLRTTKEEARGLEHLEKSSADKQRNSLKGQADPLTSGLLPHSFQWDGAGSYSFSLKNNLERSIESVLLLVIPYASNGEPLDARAVRLNTQVLPGLAHRVTVDERDPDAFDKSVQGQNSEFEFISLPPKHRVEIRILDFTLGHATDRGGLGLPR